MRGGKLESSEEKNEVNEKSSVFTQDRHNYSPAANSLSIYTSIGIIYST